MAEYRRPLFGEPWNAPVCDPAHIARVPTPVGERCLFCKEGIVLGDRGWLTGYITAAGEPGKVAPIHAECDARSVAGSIGHLNHRCSCFGGVGNGDIPGLSLHENALRVWEHLGFARPTPERGRD